MTSSSHGKLTAADVTVIVVYLLGVIIVGIWSMFQSKRGTVSGYFLAGRFITCLPVGMSLFASNIGSEHLVGLSGSGAAGGIGVGAFEINALMFLQVLGFVFVPVYLSSAVYTLPEYMHKRFVFSGKDKQSLREIVGFRIDKNQQNSYLRSSHREKFKGSLV